MRLVATILADGVVVDALTGRTSLLNLFDTWNVGEVPSVLGTSVVVTLYETEPQPAEAFERVRLLAPDGASLMESRAHLRSPARVPQEGPYVHTSVHFVAGVTARAYGEHSVVVEHSPRQDGEWREVSRRTILVRRPPQQPQALVPVSTGTTRPPGGP